LRKHQRYIGLIYYTCTDPHLAVLPRNWKPYLRRSSSNLSSCISDCVGTQFGTVRCAVALFNCYSGGRSAL